MQLLSRLAWPQTHEGRAMARYNPSVDLSALYATMDRLRADCLIGDGSLLQPQRKLWTADGFRSLHEHFVQNLDAGEGDFFGKLRDQLADAPAHAKQLMAELLWLLYAFQRAEVSTRTKNEKIRAVWAWSGEKLPDDVQALAEQVLLGVGRAGMGYNSNKWRELVMLITAMQALKSLPEAQRRVIVSEAAAFSHWLDTFDPDSRRQLRHILNFLMFPDVFERISAGGNKRDILTAFGKAAPDVVKKWSRRQVDDALFTLRHELEAKHGPRVDFYEGEFAEKWRIRKAPKISQIVAADSEGLANSPSDIPPARSGRITDHPLNTTFYGPPGTGKTFHTAARAVLICNGQVPEDAAELRETYHALQQTGRIAFVTFHQSYTYEDFVEGMRPKPDGAGFTLEPEPGILRIIAQRAIDNPGKNFVLIIDEINRANVAKVLGELITLLEEDKRIGGKAAVSLTLPYSKDLFALPPNLYLIGTMNTADRSITLLDTALRRRFVFEELAPDGEALKGISLDDTTTDLAQLLDGLNRRLIYFLGEDAQIGHAWFMSVRTKADLDKVMAFKVIPLLKEYFHDDLDLVWQLLGSEDGFLRREVIAPPKRVKVLSEVRYRYYDLYASEEQYDEDAYLALMA